MVGLRAGTYGGQIMTSTPRLPPPTPPMPGVRHHGTATAALVLGVLGLTMVPGLGVVAWILGHMAEREIDATPEAGWTNREHARAGKILGIVGTIFAITIFAITIFLLIIFFVMVGAAADA